MQRQLKGFTMVELSLSMVFIGVLSLIIITMIMDAVSSYRRGITLNQINTTGMDLVDDIRLAVQASPARSLTEECTELYSSDARRNCIVDEGKSLMLVKRYGTVQIGGVPLPNEVPIYGAFCTGKYSYIWNTGYLFSESAAVTSPTLSTGVRLKYKLLDGTVNTTDGQGRLLKLNDEDRMVCKVVAGYISGTSTGNAYLSFDNVKYSMGDLIDITSIAIEAPPEDLLQSDEFTSLALYDLSSAVPARVQSVNSSFYSMSFILGTLQGGADINSASNNCKPPEDAMSEFDYCAINKFNFAAQAIGG